MYSKDSLIYLVQYTLVPILGSYTNDKIHAKIHHQKFS